MLELERMNVTTHDEDSYYVAGSLLNLLDGDF